MVGRLNARQVQGKRKASSTPDNRTKQDQLAEPQVDVLIAAAGDRYVVRSSFTRQGGLWCHEGLVLDVLIATCKWGL